MYHPFFRMFRSASKKNDNTPSPTVFILTKLKFKNEREKHRGSGASFAEKLPRQEKGKNEKGRAPLHLSFFVPLTQIEPTLPSQNQILKMICTTIHHLKFMYKPRIAPDVQVSDAKPADMSTKAGNRKKNYLPFSML